MDVGVAKLVSRLSKSEIRIRHPPNEVADAWRIIGGRAAVGQYNLALHRLPFPALSFFPNPPVSPFGKGGIRGILPSIALFLFHEPLLHPLPVILNGVKNLLYFRTFEILRPDQKSGFRMTM